MEKKAKKVLSIKRLKGGIKVKTEVKAGTRRKDIDHVGLYNF